MKSVIIIVVIGVLLTWASLQVRCGLTAADMEEAVTSAAAVILVAVISVAEAFTEAEASTEATMEDISGFLTAIRLGLPL